MTWLKRFISLVALVALLLLTLGFLLENELEVQLNFWLWTFSTTLGSAVVIGFLLGLVIVFFSTALIVVSCNMRVARMQKRVDAAEAKLRSAEPA